MENWMNNMAEYDKRIGIPDFEIDIEKEEIEASKKAEKEGLTTPDVSDSSERGCDTCKHINNDGKAPCITCGDGDYINWEVK